MNKDNHTMRMALAAWLRRTAWVVMFFSLAPADVWAWGPIAHYVIAKIARFELGWQYPLAVEHFANLPDYRESKTANLLDDKYSLAIGQRITSAFCWSHGVQDTGLATVQIRKIGKISYRVVAPLAPFYPDDGRYPGPMMREFLQNKLYVPEIARNSPEHYILMNTINGFRAHNAADRVVHFDFFLAARPSMATGEEQVEAWVIHHGLKEIYAEYVLLAYYGFLTKPRPARW